jgi:DNA/RNA endonuclease G (NUC1)/V8-like Glu-specific endopeptidase
MSDIERLVKAAVSRVEAGDQTLGDELQRVRRAKANQGPTGPSLESARPDTPQLPAALALETIVLRVGRPVLAVVDDAVRLEFAESESEVWRTRLQAVSDVLKSAARAVGRINVTGHPWLQWVGTGWLVSNNTILTNRHVAREFGRRTSDQFTFASGGTGTPMAASVDFLAEVDRDARREFRIVEILHIEEDDGPDIALLRVEESSSAGVLSAPIRLADRESSALQQVAVIGYPARDSRIPDSALVQSIFGDVYDRKRLAPGQVTAVRGRVLLHDCSTLGGNSGSVVLDLPTGEAVGLHVGGRFLQENYAVPATVLKERLEAARRNASTARPPSGVQPQAPAGTSMPAPHILQPGAAEDAEAEFFVEAVPGDYVARRGYESSFLGDDVPLPGVVAEDDVLTFPWEGGTERELRYQHFSVVMSRSRRLCLMSAVNIDGAQKRRYRRPPWRLDPRISTSEQIRDECYGNSPRFSRGHMTRREDPIWGEASDAQRANGDSMHVTNAVPQMQPFNGGIWLGLEDYALDHTVEDKMRVSVFTGPFLLASDPVRFNVQIPVSFWKLIVFIHDETRELSATGYTLSQELFLREEEYVFGQYETWQVPISTIATRAGLSVGNLTALDPLADTPEAPGTPLTDFQQIRLRRR